MNFEVILLNLLIWLPLIGSCVIFVGNNIVSLNKKRVTIIGMVFSLIVCFISIFMYKNFFYTANLYELNFPLIKNIGLNYSISLSELNLPFILLTTILFPIIIMVVNIYENYRIPQFVCLFLILETIILYFFLNNDLLVLYILFEAVLIPMYFIVGIWGGENKIHAAFKLFLYTLAGSLIVLAAIIYLKCNFTAIDLNNLRVYISSLAIQERNILWLLFFIGLAVKVPMWPLHSWLPIVHVEAPTAGSAILAGVLLKMGGFGMIRILIEGMPESSIYFSNLVYILSIIAIIYASLMAFAQRDMKKLIAFSSVAHMGYVTLGMFAMNKEGVQSAIMQMISHGFVSAALFICIGVLYKRVHTKYIKFYGGVTKLMPRFAVFFMIFTMASVGLPGTSGFVGEFLSILSISKINMNLAVLASLGVVLGAAYMLWLYSRVMFGKTKFDLVSRLSDIKLSETIIFVSLSVVIIVIGIYPSIITNLTNSYVQSLIENINLIN